MGPSVFFNTLGFPFIFMLEVADIRGLPSPPSAGSGRRRILAFPTAMWEIAFLGEAELASAGRAMVRGAVVHDDPEG